MTIGLKQKSLEILQGASYVERLPIVDTDSNQVDLTGYTARSLVKKSYSSKDILFNLTTENAGIEIDGSDLVLRVSPEASGFISFKHRILKFVFDIEIEDPAGFVTRVYSGTGTLVKNVTADSDTNAVAQAINIASPETAGVGGIYHLGNGVTATREVVPSIEDDQAGIYVENPAGVLGDIQVGLDIDNLDSVGQIANDDQVIVYDESTGKNTKVSVSELHSNLQSVVTAADNQLQTNIDNYATANDLRIDNLDTARATEAADLASYKNDRANERLADITAATAVTDQIDTDLGIEINTRQSGDANLQASITQEIADRVAGDAGLSATIIANEIARDTSDTAQNTRMDGIDQDIIAEANTAAAATANIASDLQSYETSNDAVIVSNETARDSRNTADEQALAQEVTDRTTADNTIASDLQSYETSNDAAIAGNETARDTRNLADEQALATEITNRTNADTAINNTVSALDSSAVKISGDQSIAGHKTYTGDVTVEGLATLNNVIIKSQNELDVGDAIILLNAEETGSPSIDAGFEIERGTDANVQFVWDESADTFAAGVAGGSLIPVVLDNDARLSDARTAVAHNHAASEVNSGTFADARIAQSNVTQHQAALSITESQISNFDDYLPLSGGNLTGDIQIVNDDARITIDAQNASTPRFYLQTDNTTLFDIQGISSRTLLRHYFRSGSGENRMEMYDDSTRFDHEVRGIDSTNIASFTTRGYVDSNFVDLTSTETIGGAKVFADYLTAQSVFQVNTHITSGNTDVNFAKPAKALNTTVAAITDDLHYTPKGYVDDNFLKISSATAKDNFTLERATGNPQLTINAESATAATPKLVFQQAGVDSADVWGISDRLFLRYYNAGVAANTLSLYADRTETLKEIRGPLSTHVDSYVPRAYVDDNFVDLTNAQNIDGAKTFTTNITVDKPTGNPALELDRDGVLSTDLTSLAGRTLLRQYIDGGTDTELNLYETAIVSNKVMRAATPVNSVDLTTKGYVDDNFVDDTSAQSIAGAKTFTNNLKVASSVLELDGAETLTTFVINTDHATSSTRISMRNNNDIQSEINSYTTRMRLARKNDTDGDTLLELWPDKITANKDVELEGDLLIDQAADHVFVKLDAGPTENSYLEFLQDGTRTAILSAFATSTVLSRPSGAAITLRDSNASFSHDLEISGSLDVDTTIDAGSNIRAVGDIEVGDGSASNVNPKIIINSPSNGNPYVDFEKESVRTGQIVGLGNRLQLSHTNTGITSTLALYNNAVISDVSVRCQDFVQVNSTSGNPSLILERDGVDSMALFGAANYNIIRRYNSSGTQTNQFFIRDDEVEFQSDVSIDGSIDATADITTLGNLASKDLVLNDLTGNPAMFMQRNGVSAGLVVAYDNRLSLEHPEPNETTSRIELWKDELVSTVPLIIEGQSANGAHLTLKERDGFGDQGFTMQASNSMTADVHMVFPSDSPSVGDVLKVSSISGGKVFMQWVAP